MPRILTEVFSLQIVIADAQRNQQLAHRRDHSRRSREVVNGPFRPDQVPLQHLSIDASFFLKPGGIGMSSDGWNECEIRILGGHRFELFDERGISNLPI